MSATAARLAAANETIEWAHNALELTYEDIAEAIGAHRRSVARWRAGEVVPSRRHREAMEKLRVLRYLIESVFETRDDSLRWLHASVPALRGRTPASLLAQGSVDEVIEVLAGLESGAVA